MQSTDDKALLREFVERQSDEAFAALVTQHVNLVYSVAMRQVGNSHDAEEITQAVFIILVKKASQLRHEKALSSWLFQTTRLTANNFIRSEMRRHRREQEANMQSVLNEFGEEVWQNISPLLDSAVAELGEKDRQAVVLRFYEGKNLREVGEVLGASEDAAEKRVSRALEKLRKFFAKRGVATSIAILAGAISANSVQAAPAVLAKTAAVAALAKGAAAGSSTAVLVKGVLKTMTWMKFKTAGIAAACIIAAAGGTKAIVYAAQTQRSNPSAIASPDSMLIVPGVSVGNIRRETTREEIIAEFGEPDRVQGTIMVYDKRYGMSVAPLKSGGVAAVFCGDSAPDNRGVNTFKGRTKEGIGMNSTRAEIIQTFGEPSKTESFAAGLEQLEYKALGLSFILGNEKVIHITVNLRSASGPVVALATRNYKLNPQKFIPNLQRLDRAPDESVEHVIQRFFQHNGIQTNNPATNLHWNDKTAMLLIRYPRDDLKKIDALMEKLNSN